MKKVNLFEELLQERNKQISTNELTSLLKNIWTKEDSKKERITQSLKDTNNESFNQLKFEEMETKNIFRPTKSIRSFLTFKTLFANTLASIKL